MNKLGYKVPFRAVHCESLGGWLRCTFWCHAVIRVFPLAHDFGSDALTGMYVEKPETMGEQLGFYADRAEAQRAVA